MRTYLKGEHGLTYIDEREPNCWINVEQPNQSDIDFLIDELDVPSSFLDDIQDVDERPRIEYEDGWQFIVMRIPIKDLNARVPYSTVPLGFMLKGDIVVSVCYYKTEMIKDFIAYTRRKKKGFTNRYTLVLRLMLSASVWFLKYLKQLNLRIKASELELERSIKNKELQALLQIEKCFVFFITSIKGNNILLHRLRTLKIEFDEDDLELLEDVDIETRQALETSNIHSDILSGMMDAYASVISNNVNDIMKRLTSISIILMIPTLIASFYGMNVPNAWEENGNAFLIIASISLTISAITVIIFRRRRWF